LRANRRLLVLASALVVTFGASAPARADDKKPNVLFIVADDLGWKDVGYHGSDIKTPAIDALAAGGARFEQFYAQPMCTPTRACLMTGRYPFRYGLQTAVIAQHHTYGLSTDEQTLPQALHDAGYETAIVGKWHLGHSDRKYWPRQRGFDHQYGPLIGEIDYFTHQADGVVDWYRDNERVVEEGYSTTLIGDDAVKLISGHDVAKPLYLYLTFNAAHTPYQATPEYLARYKDAGDAARQAYAGSITAMDDQIARVLDALEKKKMRENTLVFFMSDNGGTRNAMFTGAIADVSKLKIPCDNGPYREGKGMLYEGGTRVVALANWPGHVKAGVVQGMMHAVDTMPTIAALAGATVGKEKPLDGMNVWATMSNGDASPRTEVVYNIEPFRAALRRGDWKLVWNTTLPARTELFDLAEDVGEKNDLSARHPEKVVELQKRLNELSAQGAKPLFLTTEIGSMMERMHTPPALPGEETDFANER
jgi:arylsulfatase A-like enzyme